VRLLETINEAKRKGRSLPEIKAALESQLGDLEADAVDLGAEEHRRTHQAIVNLATKEFVRRGYRDTHLADLIRRLGISSSVFYNHFPSKRQLLVECYRTFIEWSIDFVEPRVEGSGDMIDHMLARTAAGISLHTLNSDILALVNSESLQAQPELLAQVQESWRKIDEKVAQEVAGMRGPGTSPPPIPDRVLAHVLGEAFHGGMIRARSDSTFPLDDFVRTMVWLWLAVQAAMSGRVDISGTFAQYEERIEQMLSTPPPVFPPLDDGGGRGL